VAWSASKIYTAFITDALNSTITGGPNLDANTIKASLFDNSITPSQTVASASSAYGAGVWASGGVSDSSGWPAAGVALTGVTSTFSSATYTFDAIDTPSNNSSTTLTANYGCLVYDDTITAPVADQGICFNYFGGSQSVTAGTFTIVWNASGIFTIAV
jgi:hypothetical protein